MLTRYGKRKTYKILEVDYKLNPNSQFRSDKLGGLITYSEYYKKTYGLPLSTVKQPLMLLRR